MLEIIQCSEKGFWYERFIGKFFDVSDVNDHLVFVTIGRRKYTILRKDVNIYDESNFITCN